MEYTYTEKAVGSTSNNDRLITVKQAAKYYGDCDVSTIWRWVKSGEIPKPVKVGGRTLWRESEIQKSIREAK